MARKSNRVRLTVPDEAPTVRLEMPKASEPNNENEFRFMVADLKRVAILAAGIFAMLVVLSFFIR